MPLNILTKFDEDRVKIARVRERTKSISMNLVKNGRIKLLDDINTFGWYPILDIQN